VSRTNHGRKTFVTLMLVLIIPIFQNCAGGFSTESSSDAAGAGSLGSGSVGSGGASTGTGGAGTTTGPTLDAVQKACKAMISVIVGTLCFFCDC
jgi:hypothetical protein